MSSRGSDSKEGLGKGGRDREKLRTRSDTASDQLTFGLSEFAFLYTSSDCLVQLGLECGGRRGSLVVGLDIFLNCYTAVM